MCNNIIMGEAQVSGRIGERAISIPNPARCPMAQVLRVASLGGRTIMVLLTNMAAWDMVKGRTLVLLITRVRGMLLQVVELMGEPHQLPCLQLAHQNWSLGTFKGSPRMIFLNS